MSERLRAEAKVAIVNDKGLHVRAATVFAQTASTFADTEVTVALRGERANGKSVMNLLLLTAARGAEVTVEVEGPEAEAVAALEALKQVIEAGFYESNGAGT